MIRKKQEDFVINMIDYLFQFIGIFCFVAFLVIIINIIDVMEWKRAWKEYEEFLIFEWKYQKSIEELMESRNRKIQEEYEKNIDLNDVWI